MSLLQPRSRHISVSGAFRSHGDGKALFIGCGVALRRGNDAAGRTVGKLHWRLRQRTICCRLHDCQQVAFQKGQNHLRFRVAETAVILNDLGPVRSQHQPEIKTAFERPPLRRHGPNRGQKNGIHTDLGDLRRVKGIGRNGSHAAGIQAGIPLPRPLMVHRGHHRHNGLSVSKAED